MDAGTQSESDLKTEAAPYSGPEISICESCPGKVVFLESGNTDGWIASDLIVDVTR